MVSYLLPLDLSLVGFFCLCLLSLDQVPVWMIVIYDNRMNQSWILDELTE